MYDGRAATSQSRSRRSAADSSINARPASGLDARSTTARLNGWTPGMSPSPQPERPSSRLVYDGRQPRPRSALASTGDRPSTGGERDFLVTVQRELEDQRESWRSEIDRLSRSTVQLADVDDAAPPTSPESVSYTHLTLPTILRV